ncbi:MAG: YqaE/Pmp3 family membrane protein [Tepidisphaeraceae bacterium]
MKLFLAIFFPPLAVLMFRGLGAAILNLILCLFFLVPGVIHAIVVVNSAETEKRIQKLMAGCPA